MKKLYIIFPVFFITALFMGCGGNSSQNDNKKPDSAGVVKAVDTTKRALDPPDPEIDSLIAAQPAIDPKDILPSNIALTIDGEDYSLQDYRDAQNYKRKYGFAPKQGQSAQFMKLLQLPDYQTVKLDFFDKLFVTALKLTGKFAFKDNKPGDSNKPQQDVIAYSYGSKQYDTRDKSSDSCKQLTYGLDCSGYFYQIFFQHKIDFAKTTNDAEHERRPENVEKALQPYFGTIKVHATDMPKVNDFESGDIIYFLRGKTNVASHIGIVLKSLDGHLIFFATTGTDCKDQTCCNANLLRGPHVRSLDGIVKDKRVHGIVRVTTEE